MTEVIDFSEWLNQRRLEQDEAEPASLRKAMDRLIDLAAERFGEKCASRFGVILAMIREEALELSRVSGESKNETCKAVSGAAELISCLKIFLDWEILVDETS